jgi:hypothetical protein
MDGWIDRITSMLAAGERVLQRFPFAAIDRKEETAVQILALPWHRHCGS